MSRHLRLDRLIGFAAAAFEAVGVPTTPAGNAARALCYADAIGIDTHGVANLERIYISGMLDGTIDARARPRTLRSVGATVLLDGGGGLGLATASEASKIAVELAHAHGVGAVSVCGSGHLGSIGYYAASAAREGCIGIAMSNCGTQRIAPSPAGGEPVLGTNPIAIAAPASVCPPFVLDMSTTVVPAGRVRRAAAAGEHLPVGILVGADGQSETDAAAYDEGRAQLLWLGGHPDTGAYKGFGLGLAVDLLCGVLSGAGCGPLGKVGEPERNVGHLFLALDVTAFQVDWTAFAARCDLLLGALLQAGGGAGRASYPGLPEDSVRRRREREGVPLGPALEAMLERVAQRCGIDTTELYGR